MKPEGVGKHKEKPVEMLRCLICRKPTTSHPETFSGEGVSVTKYTCHACWLKEEEKRC